MINKNIPTKLFLNGPELSFTTHPQDVTTNTGIATFSGIATATYPEQTPANPGVSDGGITFEWYYDGDKVTEDIGRIDSVGTASTLTLSGLGPLDDSKQVYAVANYTHTAYSQPTGAAVTVGSARSTGNPFNEPKQSNSASISVDAVLQIDTQPTDSVLAAGLDHDFNVEASIQPARLDLSNTIQYQWQLNGNDLEDGTSSTVEVIKPSGSILTIDEGAAGSSTRDVDFSVTPTFNDFTPGTTYTLTVDGDFTVDLKVVGAGGGGSGFRNVNGSRGGRMEGRFTFKKGETYKLQVGVRGEDGSLSDSLTDTRKGGFPGGGDAPSGEQKFNRSGAGGGYTGLFLTSVTQDNAILIAGGGGGSTGDPGTGGGGGGLEGEDGSNASNNRAGLGGTQDAGGAAGTASGSGTDGSAFQGGKGYTDGNGAAGGGGGYFGGGGGGGGGPGTGGGGSGFVDNTRITNLQAVQGGARYIGVDGEFSITFVASTEETKTISTSISGAKTKNLTINTDVESIAGVIRCKVSSTAASNSPLFSTEVNYVSLIPRELLKFEGYGTTSTATLLEKNLTKEHFVIDSDELDFDDICFYAAEKDIEIEIDMYGGKGIGFDEEGGTNYNAGFQWTSGGDGGEGGYSRINFTMKRNEEYILRGIKSNSALFLYRKASLMAVVGQGGDGGHYGDGGKGGGVNVAGQSTTSSSGGTGGTGGVLVPEGELTEEGTFGGRANPSTVYVGDAQADAGQDPGRTIKCSKGVYWRDQGKGSCEDLGTIKFRLSDGTEVTNSATIDRGFKAGYTINSTGGKGGGDGANAGHGATGGEGHNSAGGGGGSGYSDGSFEITTTQLGGSTGKARVGLRLYNPDTGFYIDDKGRILIMSCTDIRDPNTLEIKTGKIFIGDNAVLDDARWQEFLDNARDGTKNWRLTATLNNSSAKITNAIEFNIHKMMNANQLTLRDSLARGWVDMGATYNMYYNRKAMAWSETSGATITGIDYSMLWWVKDSGWGYYGWSSGPSASPFFKPTVYFQKSANYWILPPGVPDF